MLLVVLVLVLMLMLVLVLVLVLVPRLLVLTLTLILARDPRIPPDESMILFRLLCSGPSPALSEGNEGPNRPQLTVGVDLPVVLARG